MIESAASRQMHLAAFVSAGPVSGTHGGWRHPAADRNILAASYYAGIARTLEQGCFDLLFGRRIGDGEYGLALVEAVAHLNALQARGQAWPVGTDAQGGVLWRA